MSGHTPGPWFYEVHDLPLGSGKVISIQSRAKFDPVEDEDDPTLAGIYSFDDVDFANANLIAAAPDLLEALINLLDDPLGDREPARKAIARAKGEK